MKKRILPALLALCMVMSLLPTVFAADSTENKANSIGIPEAGTTESADGKTVTVIRHDASLANKHTCNLDGCTCITVTIKTETTGTGDEAVTTTTKTYAYAMCTICEASTSCNPCTGKAGCATQGLHSVDCPESCSKAEGGVKGCTKVAEHEGAHNSSVCTKDADCGATTHDDGCTQKCYFCNKTKGATSITVNDATVYLCDDCAKDATKNPCGFGNCSLPKGHTEAHNNSTCPESTTNKGTQKCGATVHLKTCADRCDVLNSAQKVTDFVEGTKSTGGDDSICYLTKGHEGCHNNEVCVAAANCGAAVHFDGKAAVEADTENDVAAAPAVPACPSSKNGTNPVTTCGKGGCTLPKGHVGDHANEECLGTNDDKHCGADDHIAGCSKYVECTCTTHTFSASASGATWDDEAFTPESESCTHKTGCAYCAEWNAFVAAKKAIYESEKAAYDALTSGGTDPGTFTMQECTCVACGAASKNPSTGALTNAEGEEVENPVAGEKEKPTKTEDFADADEMDDWMKDAVQVMLDNGWMEGTGEKFDVRGDANTNTVLAVIARMAGETITGTTWADDAKAWAEDNELTEGIEITKADIARKDIVLMLWRLAGKPEVDFELEFTDVDGLDGDYLAAMKWAASTKIVVGNGDGTATPDGTLKRAELAALVARYAALEK